MLYRKAEVSFGCRFTKKIFAAAEVLFNGLNLIFSQAIVNLRGKAESVISSFKRFDNEPHFLPLSKIKIGICQGAKNSMFKNSFDGLTGHNGLTPFDKALQCFSHRQYTRSENCHSPDLNHQL